MQEAKEAVALSSVFAGAFMGLPAGHHDDHVTGVSAAPAG